MASRRGQQQLPAAVRGVDQLQQGTQQAKAVSPSLLNSSVLDIVLKQPSMHYSSVLCRLLATGAGVHSAVHKCCTGKVRAYRCDLRGENLPSSEMQQQPGFATWLRKYAHLLVALDLGSCSLSEAAAARVVAALQDAANSSSGEALPLKSFSCWPRADGCLPILQLLPAISPGLTRLEVGSIWGVEDEYGGPSPTRECYAARSTLSGLAALPELRELLLRGACLLPAVAGLRQLTQLQLLNFSISNIGGGKTDYVYLQHLPMQLRVLQLKHPSNTALSQWSRNTAGQLGRLTALTSLTVENPRPSGLVLLQGDVLPPNLQVLHAAMWGGTPPLSSLRQLQDLQLVHACTGPAAMSDLVAGLPLRRGRKQHRLQLGVALSCQDVPLKPDRLRQLAALQCRPGVQLTWLDFEGEDCQWDAKETMEVAQVFRQLTCLVKFTVTQVGDKDWCSRLSEGGYSEGDDVDDATGTLWYTKQVRQQPQQQEGQQHEAGGQREPLSPAVTQAEAMQEWLMAVTGLPRLACLELHGLPGLSAAVVDVMAAHPAGFAAATQLTRLALEQVSITAAKLLANSLTGLRELDLGFMGGLGEDQSYIVDVVADMSALTRLARLSLSQGSTDVSHSAVAAVKSALPRLQNFRVLTRASPAGARKDWVWEA